MYAARFSTYGCVGSLLLMMCIGCGDGEPYQCVPVSGRVTYEDGSVIPAPVIKVIFVPQAPPRDVKTHPSRGLTTVDASTGEFSEVTTYRFNDGVIRGQHKVLVYGLAGNETAASGDIPHEYGDPDQTPFVVDTSDSPFHLKVRRPH